MYVYTNLYTQSSMEMDLSDIGLMSLYSEVHPTTSYIVHYGINMIAPVYKLQVQLSLIYMYVIRNLCENSSLIRTHLQVHALKPVHTSEMRTPL